MRYGRGDSGETDLFGGARVPKSDLRVDCYGEIDELSSSIGFCRSILSSRHPEIDGALREVQETLFRIAAELAAPDPSILRGIRLVGEEDVARLDRMVEELEASLPPLRHFIYPGGSEAGSALHLARAVARRAERRVVALSRAEGVNPEIVRYLNRLSTLLFAMARLVNHREGKEEEVWPGRSG